MKHNLWLIALISLFIHPPKVHSETVNDTLRRLNQTLQGVGIMEFQFTQTVHFADFDREVTSTGSAFFKKGAMRWDYHTPHVQQIFIQGDTLLLYVPEDHQVLKSPLQRRTGLPIDLFFDLGQLDAIFHVSRQAEEMTLIPKEDGSHITKMILTLSPSLVKGADLLIQKIVLYETNQNRSTFVFDHFQIHKVFRQDPFVFHLPKDVEVIERP